MHSGVLQTYAFEDARPRRAWGVPIHLRLVDLSLAVFAGLQVLREREQPLLNWSNRERALVNVVEGVLRTTETAPPRPVLARPRVANLTGSF